MQDFSFSVNFLNISSLDTRIVVMFLLAEPHFAMTIPLLYGYRKNFSTQPYLYLVVPVTIIFVSAIFFFKLPSLFFVIFLLANIYHVNRQSVGFLKLQAKLPPTVATIYEINLHLLTFTCIYFSLVRNMNSVILAIVFLITSAFFMILVCKHLIKKWISLKQLFVITQGYLIFLPIVIFEDLLLAFAVGISIHYIQYLLISWDILTKGFGFRLIPLLGILITYSIFSTGALSGVFTQDRLSWIVFIPTVLQLLHFYYDGFIWKRSDELVSNTMKKAFS